MVPSIISRLQVEVEAARRASYMLELMIEMAELLERLAKGGE